MQLFFLPHYRGQRQAIHWVIRDQPPSSSFPLHWILIPCSESPHNLVWLLMRSSHPSFQVAGKRREEVGMVLLLAELLPFRKPPQKYQAKNLVIRLPPSPAAREVGKGSLYSRQQSLSKIEALLLKWKTKMDVKESTSVSATPSQLSLAYPKK